MIQRHTTPPSLAQLENIAAIEFERIPDELRRHLGTGGKKGYSKESVLNGGTRPSESLMFV